MKLCDFGQSGPPGAAWQHVGVAKAHGPARSGPSPRQVSKKMQIMDSRASGVGLVSWIRSSVPVSHCQSPSWLFVYFDCLFSPHLAGGLVGAMWPVGSDGCGNTHLSASGGLALFFSWLPLSILPLLPSLPLSPSLRCATGAQPIDDKNVCLSSLSR